MSLATDRLEQLIAEKRARISTMEDLIDAERRNLRKLQALAEQLIAEDKAQIKATRAELRRVRHEEAFR